MDNEMTIENMENAYEEFQRALEDRAKIEEEYKIKFIQEQGIAKWITQGKIIRHGTKRIAVFIIQKLIDEKKESIRPQDAVDARFFMNTISATRYLKEMEMYGFLTSKKNGSKKYYYLTEDENTQKEIYKLLEIIREHEKRGEMRFLGSER